MADTDTLKSSISTAGSSIIIDVNSSETQKRSDIQSSFWDNDDESPNTPYTQKVRDVESHVDTKNHPTRSHIVAHRRDDPTCARNSRLHAIEKVLLLNSYPLLYIILWLPGLSNRLVEASGHSSKVLQVLQSTTQFVGLANAFTFGWTEVVARQLKQRFRKS